MTIGPVSYTVIAFPGNQFNGDIAPEIDLPKEVPSYIW